MSAAPLVRRGCMLAKRVKRDRRGSRFLAFPVCATARTVSGMASGSVPLEGVRRSTPLERLLLWVANSCDFDTIVRASKDIHCEALRPDRYSTPFDGYNLAAHYNHRVGQCRISGKT